MVALGIHVAEVARSMCMLHPLAYGAFVYHLFDIAVYSAPVDTYEHADESSRCFAVPRAASRECPVGVSLE